LGADFRRPDVLPGPLRACVPASERGIGGGDAHAREPIAAAGGLTIRAHLRYRRPAGRVRVEIVGSQKCRMVGKSQSAVMMINPIIFTSTLGAQASWAQAA
jgi:hypothetical protein